MPHNEGSGRESREPHFHARVVKELTEVPNMDAE